MEKKLFEKTHCKEITPLQKYLRIQNILQKCLGKKLFECTPWKEIRRKIHFCKKNSLEKPIAKKYPTLQKYLRKKTL